MIKPAAMVVFLAGLWLCLAHDPSSAFAASGGRMGGGSFSSSRSSFKSSSSSWSSFSSYRSSSRSYSSSSGSSYSSSISSGPSSPSHSNSKVIIELELFDAIVLFSCILFGLLWLLAHEKGNGVSNPNRRISVLKVQVGLLGSAKSLQRDLNQIAETADTSTPEGVKYILDETLKTLLKHPSYWAYGYSSSDIKNSMHEAETRFMQLSVDERGKFDKETLVNVNNMKQKYSTIKRENGAVNEFIVVTILVAVVEVYQLSAYTCSDLDRIMRNLLCIYLGDIVAVEVLWTPQEESDVLSKRDLLDNYQLLRPL